MIKTIINSVATSLGTVFIGFVLSIILARMLGPEARGVYGSILTIAILVAGLSQLGLAQGFVYQQRKLQKSGLSVLWQSGFIVGVIATFLLWLTNAAFLPHEIREYFYLVVCLGLANSWHQYFQNSAQIDPNLQFYNRLKLILPTLTIIALMGYYFVFQKLMVETAVVILLITTIFTTVCLAIDVLKKAQTLVTSHPLKLSDIYAYSMKIYGTSAIGIAINSIDKVVLLSLGTMTQFGLYSVAFGLSRLISIVPETLSTVVYARFAGQNETELAIVTKQMFACLFIPLIVMGLVLSLLSPYLMTLLFGDAYQAAALPFIFLIFEAVISSMGWLLAQRFNAAGRPGLVFIRQLVSILPLFVVFMPLQIDLMLLVSAALLCSSVIRLVMTFALYRYVFDETMPRFYFSWHEIKSLLLMLKPNPSMS